MFFKDILPNGLRVVTEEMPDVYSVTTSIWSGTGSAYETPAEAGLSHVVEHMLFKGTEKRNYVEIGELLESVGGQMNAFTSRENTCYYTRTLSDNFELSMDVLSDMYINSKFPAEEWSKEQGVILEEINMYEDSPDDLAVDLFTRTILPEHVYGKPVIGTTEFVSSFTRDHIDAYAKQHYAPNQTVLVVAGNVKREEVLAQAEKFLGGMSGTWERPTLEAPTYASGKAYIHKDIEQVHVMLGVPALSGLDANIYKLNLLNYILGGGVSSRLFQEVREKRGLTYSVYSTVSALQNGGTFAAYASSSPKNVDTLLKVLGNELAKIAAYGITPEELIRGQAQMKASLLMGLESSANVMARLGRSETNYGRILTIDELVEKVTAVTTADVQNIAKELIQPDKFVLSLVGAKDYDVDLKALIQC